MYAKVINGEVVRFPYNFMELRADYPNVSFPLDLPDERLAEFNMIRVLEEPCPTVDRFHVAAQNDLPTLVDGQWVLQWAVTAKTTEQLAAETEVMATTVRDGRNDKLRACDWTQLEDALVDKTVWQVYRQQLRDVPSQAGFPWEVIWPSLPES
jgi:hypothetical protein